MGNIIAWLLNAVRFGGPAAIGYFFNDAVTWIGKTFNTETTTTKDGQTRVKPWIIAAVFLAGGLAVYFLIKLLAGAMKGKRGKGLLMLALMAVAYAIDHNLADYLQSIGLVVHDNYQHATFLVILTTGAAAVTPANTTYLPKIFWYTAATQLTGVKITVQGDGVIFDSDANGLTHCGTNRLFGQVTNSYTFRISNGLITNKNVLWEFTNSAAQTPSVYIDSDETPPVAERLYLQLLRQVAQGPGGTDFSDFATFSAPSMAATDYANILYNDGTQQANVNRLDFQAFLQLTQNIVNTPIYLLDNYAMRIKKVNFQVTATQTCYIQRWIAPVPDGMISQAIIAKG